MRFFVHSTCENSWAVGSMSQSGFHTVGTSCLVKNVDNTSSENLLYFPRYENETSMNFYTFLDMKTRQV